MVVFDTNIIIDHLRQSNIDKPTLLEEVATSKPGSLAMSVISIQELYTGQGTLIEEEETTLLSQIAPLHILPYTYETAQLAGQIMRDHNPPPEFADAAIAATVITNNCQLLTLNKKHFTGIPGLELYTT